MDMIGDVEMAEIRKYFPVTRKTIYMNNGAVAPTPLSTIKAITNFMLRISEEGPDAVGSEEYLQSLLSEVRTRVAHLIRCDKDEIILTESTTQGLNVVSRGISWKAGDSIVVRGGSHEHLANYLPWLAVSKSKGATIKELPIDRNGVFKVADLEKAARNARLITMSHVLYNTGAVMPVEEVGKVAAETSALFCVDAAQSAGALPIDVKNIGCHFMSFPGFKWICGPLGIGILYCSKRAAELLEPQITAPESALLSDSGILASLEMPARLQGGFRNYPGAAGLEAALRYILRIGIDNVMARNRKIAAVLRDELAKIPGVFLYGPEDENERSSIVSFAVPNGTDPVILVKRLGDRGVVFAARDAGKAKKIVRATPHFFNDEAEATTAISYLKSSL